jgi:DNA-binding CsgD family transcriptional regulator
MNGMIGQTDQLSAALDVVGQFYDSILDDRHWTRACESLADYCGGSTAAVIAIDPSTRETRTEIMRIDPYFAKQYEQYFIAKEIRLPPALRFGAGVVMTEAMLIDSQELKRSEIYNEFLIPAQCPHFLFSWLTKSDTCVETIVVENTVGRGPFDADSMQRYRQLYPHFTRAVRIRKHLERLRAARVANETILDSLPYGVVFLNSQGLVGRVSRPAEKLLEAQEAIGVFKNCLRAVVRDEDARLQRAIDRAVRAPNQTLAGATLCLSRPHGDPVTAHVVPLRSQDHVFADRHISAMLLLVDPEAIPHTSRETLQISLRLTPAEACLADRLFRGESLRDASAVLGVSINTAKTQLKSIYAKTCCSSHGELVRKIMTLAIAGCAQVDLRENRAKRARS